MASSKVRAVHPTPGSLGVSSVLHLQHEELGRTAWVPFHSISLLTEDWALGQVFREWGGDELWHLHDPHNISCSHRPEKGDCFEFTLNSSFQELITHNLYTLPS